MSTKKPKAITIVIMTLLEKLFQLICLHDNECNEDLLKLDNIDIPLQID